MKYFYILCFLINISVSGQGLRQNAFHSLFSDQKANTVGDALTIIVMESSQASNNAETKTERNSELGFAGKITAGKTTLPGANANIGSGNSFDGMGSTKTSGLIRTRITATIDSVLDNGNLVIKGSRKIVIHGEEQIISIKGIVRTSDISSDNSVLSSNISEAEIVFDGNGMISDSQKPGWLTKIFHWIF